MNISKKEYVQKVLAAAAACIFWPYLAGARYLLKVFVVLTQASGLGNGGQVSKSKSKKKFGLKWFFSAPFKTGKERKPDMEEVSDSNTADTNSDVLSSRGLEDDRRLGSPAEQTPHAPLALTNAPRESYDSRFLWLRPPPPPESKNLTLTLQSTQILPSTAPAVHIVQCFFNLLTHSPTLFMRLIAVNPISRQTPAPFEGIKLTEFVSCR